MANVVRQRIIVIVAGAVILVAGSVYAAYRLGTHHPAGDYHPVTAGRATVTSVSDDRVCLTWEERAAGAPRCGSFYLAAAMSTPRPGDAVNVAYVYADVDGATFDYLLLTAP
jgi:hypothetical protein